VQGETEKIVVTLRVMRVFSVLPGAPRACMFFRDPTDVSRIINPRQALSLHSTFLFHAKAGHLTGIYFLFFAPRGGQ